MGRQLGEKGKASIPGRPVANGAVVPNQGAGAEMDLATRGRHKFNCVADSGLCSLSLTMLADADVTEPLQARHDFSFLLFTSIT